MLPIECVLRYAPPTEQKEASVDRVFIHTFGGREHFQEYNHVVASSKKLTGREHKVLEEEEIQTKAGA